MKIKENCGQPIVAIRNTNPLRIIDLSGKEFRNMGFMSLACKTKDEKYFIYHCLVANIEGQDEPIINISEKTFDTLEEALTNFYLYSTPLKKSQKNMEFDILVFDKNKIYTVNSIERELSRWIKSAPTT